MVKETSADVTGAVMAICVYSDVSEKVVLSQQPQK